MEDRPAHVRAGSGLAFFHKQLAIIQDDANFIALVDPSSAIVHALTLPRGVGGLRQFDDVRGNKSDKYDLEACITVPLGDDEALLAFGSGSSSQRENVVILIGETVRVTQAPELYAAMRAERRFSGSELNVEGVVLIDDQLRFFNRGNGQGAAVNATVDVGWRDFQDYMLGKSDVPALHNIVQYELGVIGDTALSFTDATLRGASIMFVAAAEASPDAISDGPVAGSVIGIISDEVVRWTGITTADGKVFDGKVEGVAIDPDDRNRAWLLIDRDDPARATELCLVALRGWPE